MIELAEPGRKRKRTYVQGYNRKANYVPGYSRSKPHLNDSSLFSFRLNDCNCEHPLNGGAVVNRIPYLVVPDPCGTMAPRAVRVDMFDDLPEEEFCALLDYVQDHNDQETIDLAIVRYMDTGMADPIPFPGNTAIGAVLSVFETEPNDETVTTTSFWDETTFGIPNKVAVPGGALLLYLLLKK